MAADTDTITVSCENHHQKLSNGLWKLFLANYGLDFCMEWGGRSIRAHRLILDVFLSPDKLLDTAAGQLPDDHHDGRELDSLLQFLYRGTVTISKDRLENLLEVSKKSDFTILVAALESARETHKPIQDSAKKSVNTEPDKSYKTILRSNPKQSASSPTEHPAIILNSLLIAASPITNLTESNSTPVTKIKQPGRIYRRSTSVKGRHTCGVCGSDFSQRETLEKHALIHDSVVAYKCDLCKTIFTRNEELLDHLPCCQHIPTPLAIPDHPASPILARVPARQPSGRSYKCGQCDQTFTKPRFLEHHLHTEHSTDTKCNFCGSEFDQADQFYCHSMIHASKRPHVCHLCPRMFATSDNLRLHLGRHAGVMRIHPCPECQKTFASGRLLSRHRRIHNPDRQPPAIPVRIYNCPVCNKNFSRTEDFRDHERMHRGEKPFICEHCGKDFCRKSALYKHLTTHSFVKAFECSHCQMAFNSRPKLANHTRTHTKEKPYVCHLCGKSFSGRTNLTVHFRSHTGLKPFKCKECGSCFIQSGDLRRHARIHFGGKAYSCPVCAATFLRSDTLARHTRTHDKAGGSTVPAPKEETDRTVTDGKLL